MTGSRAAEPAVVIAGGGPVGMLAALLLARWRVPTILLEARPARTTVGSRAICFQRDVLDILDRVGVADAAVAEGVTWQRGLTFHRDRVLFEITFPPVAAGARPPFINLSQRAMEDLLWGRVADAPLVDLRLAHRVVDLEQDDDGVTVTAETPDGDATVRGAWLLGCDGAHSAVRRQLGLPLEGHSYAEQFLIADIRTDLPFPAERRFYFDPPWNPGRQVLVHPQPHSVWRIDWQVPADFDLDRERASGALDDRIRRITGDAPYEVVWVSAYRFHQRIVPSYRVGRVLLAGDAAHLFSPFGARGLNSGAQDAENAAWKVAFACHGWAGPGLLPSYDLERRAAGLENLRVTDATMRFLAPHDEAGWRRRRGLLARAPTDPAALAQVDSGTLAEPYWYLDSPLTTPGVVDDFPRDAGVARPVVPGVLCPDAPCEVPGRPEVRRLRQLFGSGFAVLAHAVDTGWEQGLAGVDAPVEVHRLDRIARDPGALAATLDAPPDTLTVVRPDGHLAARTAPDAQALEAVLRRACGDAV
jgi:2-polyprenyl-6-methoxyphenol hydroxylase-like FAD-dependent oxidoreductase